MCIEYYSTGICCVSETTLKRQLYVVWQNKDRLLVYLTFSGQYFMHIQTVGNRGNDFCLPLENYGELGRNERFSLFWAHNVPPFFEIILFVQCVCGNLHIRHQLWSQPFHFMTWHAPYSPHGDVLEILGWIPGHKYPVWRDK